MSTWIWEQSDWPAFRWRDTEVSPVLARARLAQGRILGAAGLLDPSLTLDADASILIEDGVQTSAIEGERLDLDAVRSSVARHLGLPAAGLQRWPIRSSPASSARRASGCAFRQSRSTSGSARS